MPLRRRNRPVLVLFDGVCNFCNASVNFIIDRDRAARFQFASQQSAMGQQILRAHGLSTATMTTVIVLDTGRIFTQSAAVLRIARHLPWPWPLLQLGVVVPRPIADPLYLLVARNRYRLFGRSATCRVPMPELAGRVIA